MMSLRRSGVLVCPAASRATKPLILLLLAALSANAANHYVSPAGRATASGTIADPWDLRTALAHPAAVQAGDTIWVRGGTYSGTFISQLNGTAEKPIIVRRYLSERAKLLGPATTDVTLTIAGAYTWFWGLEFTSPAGLRAINEGPLTRGPAIITAQIPGSGVGTKLINLVIHDGAIGIGLWKEALNSEVHGSIIYNNGWDDFTRGHGHGIYAQNDTGTMTLSDNIIFNQFAYGIHVYGSSAAFLNNFVIVGNILFNNGILSQRSGLGSNLLVGGGVVCKDPLVQENYTYFSPNACCGANDVPYEAGCTRARVINNYFAAPGQLALRWYNSNDVVITGNTFYGEVQGASAGQFSNNTMPTSTPSNAIFVRPNKYEARRGNVAVFNWQRKSSVQINLAVLGYTVGQAYTIRNAQNYYGTAINGVYSGSPVNIPMTTWTVAAPAGMQAPPSTFPEFGAFVIEPR